MSGHRHVAVADYGNKRVSVFSVEGEFVRHVGVGKSNWLRGVACSAFDELVVADYGNRRVVVFSARGELLKTMGGGGSGFTGVAIHGGTIFAQDLDNSKCIQVTPPGAAARRTTLRQDKVHASRPRASSTSN
jgi:hypothetical protein